MLSAKTCSKCGLDKPLTEFYVNTSNGHRYPRADCKPCNNAYHKQYHRDKPRYFNYKAAKSRAKRQGVTEFLSLAEWKVLEMGTNCCWCGMLLERSFANIDHVLPLSEGGQHTAANLVLACANCNQRRRWEAMARRREEIELQT